MEASGQLHVRVALSPVPINNKLVTAVNEHQVRTLVENADGKFVYCASKYTVPHLVM
jgi:hypothetical protein